MPWWPPRSRHRARRAAIPLTSRHAADGANEPYAYSYLFAYSLDLPAEAKTLRLPNNERIRILAVTVANEIGDLRPAQPLYDTLER